MHDSRRAGTQDAEPSSGRIKGLLLAFLCVLALVLLTGEPRVARAQIDVGGLAGALLGGGRVYIGPRYRHRGGYSRRGYSRRVYVSRRHGRGHRDRGSVSARSVGSGSQGLGKAAAGSGRVKSTTTD